MVFSDAALGDCRSTCTILSSENRYSTKPKKPAKPYPNEELTCQIGDEFARQLCESELVMRELSEVSISARRIRRRLYASRTGFAGGGCQWRRGGIVWLAVGRASLAAGISVGRASGIVDRVIAALREHQGHIGSKYSPNPSRRDRTHQKLC